MRIIALIDDADVVECILTHLKVWDPIPDPISPAGADPPWPDGETLPLSYHPVPDIACAPVWTPVTPLVKWATGAPGAQLPVSEVVLR